MTVWKDLNEEMHCSMQSFPPHYFQLSIMRFVYFTVNFITHTSALPLSIAERLNGVFCSTNRTTVLTRVNFYKKNTSKSVTIKRINIWMIAKLIKWSEQTYWRIENSLSVVDDRAQNIGGKNTKKSPSRIHFMNIFDEVYDRQKKTWIWFTHQTKLVFFNE